MISTIFPNIYKNVDFTTVPGALHLVFNILQFMLFIAGLLAVIFVMIGGVMYSTSGGDEKRVVKARGAILNAVVGLVLVSLAYVIVKYIAGKF